MANLLSRLRASEARSTFPAMSLQDYFTMLFQQQQYVGQAGASPLNPGDDFVAFVRNIHERNGVVSAAAVARALLVSQVRFVWRNNRSSATPGRVFGDRSLEVLERPGQVTRPELLYGAEMDVTYAGNAFIVREGSELVRLRPDKVTIALTSAMEPGADGALPADARVAGIIYKPSPSADAVVYEPGEYAHWRPEIHPLHWWRGASWVTSLIDEVSIDHQATRHTESYFERAATPNLVYVMPETLTATQVEEYADAMDARHSGAANAYKSMYLGGGADVKVVGSDLSSIGLRDMQGSVETRIASRSRVPAVVLGIREGMQGSALNSGNYSQTRRLWADGWFAPHVQNLCAAIEAIVPPAADAELWYDSSEVLFLQEDQKDAAEIAHTNAQAIRAYTEAGYEPDSVVEAVATGDVTKLRHTGVFSVQLQPPTSGESAPDNDGGPE